jgi:hypothetical protein
MPAPTPINKPKRHRPQRKRPRGRQVSGRLTLAYKKLSERRLDRLVASHEDMTGELAGCIKTIHATVLRLGGIERFPSLLHATLLDVDVSPDTKAQILSHLTLFWMLTSSMYERVHKRRMDELPDGDLIEEVGRLIHKQKTQHAIKTKGAGRAGRPRLIRQPGDPHFVGPLQPTQPVADTGDAFPVPGPEG